MCALHMFMQYKCKILVVWKNDLPAIYEHYVNREWEYDALRFCFVLQILDSSKLFIKNLKVSTGTGQQSRPGYQLCMCSTGLLFIADADKECQGTREICSQIFHVCPERTSLWTDLYCSYIKHDNHKIYMYFFTRLLLSKFDLSAW